MRSPQLIMTTTTEKLLTADDLLTLYSQGVRGELIRGVLHETVAAGIEHGEIVINFAAELRTFVRPRRLGRVVGSDAGMRLERDPDTVREPDIAFISAERLPLDQRVSGYAEVVPDIVVEVSSPGDRTASIYDQAQMWLRHGVRLVLIAYPETRTILALPANGPARTFAEGDDLECGDILPGFTCPVRNIFDS